MREIRTSGLTRGRVMPSLLYCLGGENTLIKRSSLKRMNLNNQVIKSVFRNPIGQNRFSYYGSMTTFRPSLLLAVSKAVLNSVNG
jgi:hypothetical protein